MKALIWIAVCFVYGLIVTMMAESGIILGGIPTAILVGVLFSTARYLCSRWDVKTFNKEASKQGMSPRKYAQLRFNLGLLNACDANSHDKKALKSMLKTSAKNGVISKSDANVLFDMFYQK